ncbi:MAG: hypothetical protein H0X25_17675 [Acidobacteriales bacterium]|nr:hypothetical protein [Terriglobales bacterium]
MCRTPTPIAVHDSFLSAQLKNFHPGDHVALSFVPADEAKDLGGVLRNIQITITPVSSSSLCWIVAVTAAAYVLLAALFTGFRPLRLIIGMDNRYSNSKFQVALWFAILIVTYAATFWVRLEYGGWAFLDSITIPTNLLLLSGLSAITFGGAKAITQTKVDAAAAHGIMVKAPAASPSFMRDLFQNDRSQVDFGDFQMIVVTLLAAAVYIVIVLHSLAALELRKTVSLPDVDSTILAAFGLGQGAYLTKKAVGNVGEC